MIFKKTLKALFVIAIIINTICIYELRRVNRLFRNAEIERNKYNLLFQLMNEWVNIKQEKKNLAVFFNENGFKRIAIYGMNHVGKTLLKELEDTDIEVVYGIDRNANGIICDIPIKTLNDNLIDVDAIVVTPITYYDEIERQLRGSISCPIISLDDIVFDV